SDIRTIADHSHRSAHGGARIYQSDAFPASQRGRIFMANIHEHGVLSDVLKRKGSGFEAAHGDDFVMANNAQWVGFSMEIGPDGGLYVLDWHDADICGQEVLNAQTGRIFRIAPTQSPAENWPGRYGDLKQLSDKELVALQTSKSDWHARRARVILHSRAATGKLKGGAYAGLRKLFAPGNDPDHRLRAMWALHVTGGFTGNALAAALKDPDEYVRAWAVQLLCEDRSPSPAVLAAFTQLATSDPSPVVRLYLASALQRVDREAAWGIASALVAHGEDTADHNLPKVIWFGLEPLVALNPPRALELAAGSKIPVLTQYIARRAVDANAAEAVVAALGQQPKNRLHLLEGMRNGLEGRTDAKPPVNWPEAYERLQRTDGPVAQLAREVAGQFGDGEAARQALATLQNRQVPAEERRKALQALARGQRRDLVPELPALLDDPDLRPDAIRAVAGYDEEELGRLLMKKYPDFAPADKLEAVQTLASRPRYGWMLTTALKNNAIPKRDVPTYVARQLRRVVGSGFVEVWGPIDQLATDEKAYAKYRTLLTARATEGADVKKGQALFQRTCGSCHKMYGEGGNIGPDLTGSNRTNVDYLLFNVLNPSGEIQDDYKMVEVTTRDGRTYSGNVVSENERQLTLRVVGQDAVVLNKSNIQSREVAAVSMMPQGLFETLSDQEVVDLVGYLRTMR
ncbi:MAG: c-type cytochrome, partial [Cytophagales bacterium]|nr:c-type cytochrome [Cytophagales bacterium]